MQPTVTPFHHAATGTWSYVVADPATRVAAVIDPVLDYDWKSARTGTQAVDQLIAHCREQGLTVRWILETHAHADHLSSAQYVKQQLGGEVAIGAGITSVQRTRMDRDVWLWWIELVHEDPARDLVLWASDEDFASSDGLELVRRMSEMFGLRVLTTSGLREATAEDERRLAEHVSPWQAVARQLRRKSNGLPSQPD